MKKEIKFRNSRDKFDDKVMVVLEYYLSLHEADEIFNALYDQSLEVKDIIELLYKF